MAKEYEGRCMKCRTQKKMKSPTIVKMKNGMYAAKGNCPKCDTKMYRIIGKKKPE